LAHKLNFCQHSGVMITPNFSWAPKSMYNAWKKRKEAVRVCEEKCKDFNKFNFPH